MAASTRRSGSSGAPRWTYILGALVAAAGLLWTIASQFIMSPGSSATSDTEVTVSGSGSVGVGTMSGGEINFSDSTVETTDEAKKAPDTPK